MGRLCRSVSFDAVLTNLWLQVRVPRRARKAVLYPRASFDNASARAYRDVQPSFVSSSLLFSFWRRLPSGNFVGTFSGVLLTFFASRFLYTDARCARRYRVRVRSVCPPIRRGNTLPARERCDPPGWRGSDIPRRIPSSLTRQHHISTPGDRRRVALRYRTATVLRGCRVRDILRCASPPPRKRRHDRTPPREQLRALLCVCTAHTCVRHSMRGFHGMYFAILRCRFSLPEWGDYVGTFFRRCTDFLSVAELSLLRYGAATVLRYADATRCQPPSAATRADVAAATSSTACNHRLRAGTTYRSPRIAARSRARRRAT